MGRARTRGPPHRRLSNYCADRRLETGPGKADMTVGSPKPPWETERENCALKDQSGPKCVSAAGMRRASLRGGEHRVPGRVLDGHFGGRPPVFAERVHLV